MSESMISTI